MNTCIGASLFAGQTSAHKETFITEEFKKCEKFMHFYFFMTLKDIGDALLNKKGRLKV